MNSGNSSQGTGRVLLSGASGMLGSALQAEFRERHAHVIQLVRRAPTGEEELQWDPEAATPIRDAQALEGLDAAIHLSGSSLAAHRWTPEYRREMAASRVNSTRALATTLAGLRHPPQALLAASAVGIYGNRGDEVLDESSPAGSGFLAEVCQAWEAASLPAAAAGIRVVNMRFGVVLAPGSGALAQMLPIFRLGLGGRLGSGRQWMSWIGLADLIAAVSFVLDSTPISGAVNFTSPQPATNAEFTRALARQLHRPAVLPAPAFALRLALGPMADEALLASARALPNRLLNAGFRFSPGTIGEALSQVI